LPGPARPTGTPGDDPDGPRPRPSRASREGHERGSPWLQDDAGWHFAPANPHLDSLAAELAALYRERPMYTIGLIARPDPLQSLANAFRIKRDET